MANETNGAVIANRVRMIRDNYSGVVLIVEGPDDSRIFSLLVSKQDCQIVIAFGKKNALDAAKILADEKDLLTIAVIDADFKRIETSTELHPNVFVTDYHDIETMMIMSSAFETVLSEFGSTDKLKKFVAESGVELREFLLQQSSIVGALRLHSIRRGLNLKFKDLNFGEFYFEDPARIDLMECVKCVLNKSQLYDIDATGLSEAVTIMLADGHPTAELSCGHDTIALLQRMLRKSIGTISPSKVTEGVLHQGFRLAYHMGCFSRSTLYSQLHEWQTRVNSVFLKIT